MALVRRIGLAGKLIGHEDCVNTIEFNRCGDRLVSGSDDRRVLLWNVASRCLVLSYDSGHVENILQARIMPFSDDMTIVTSGGDGQVRLGQVADNGNIQTIELGKHNGRVHKLAVDPGSPYILYSCGEDGFVQHYDLRSNSSTKLFCCSTPPHSQESTICCDEYARIYDIRKLPRDQDGPVETFCPKLLINTPEMHITGLSYSNKSELLVSYNGELIYLFQKNMGLGPYPAAASQEHVDSLDQPQMYSGHRNNRTIKGVSFFGPSSEYIMSGSYCGHVFIWNKKDGRLIRIMEGNRCIVNQVEPHPNIPAFASSGLEKDIQLWAPVSDNIPALVHDLRKVMESSRQARDAFSRLRLRPEVFVNVFRHNRRQ